MFRSCVRLARLRLPAPASARQRTSDRPRGGAAWRTAASHLRQGRTSQSLARSSCGVVAREDGPAPRERGAYRNAASAVSAISSTADDAALISLTTIDATTWAPELLILGQEAMHIDGSQLNGIHVDGIIRPSHDLCRKPIKTPSTTTLPKDDGRHSGFVETVARHYLGEKGSSGGSGNDGGGTFGGNGNDGGDPTGLRPNRRANVQLPPGYGKTSLALRAITRMAQEGSRPDGSPARMALYVTPTLVLVDQVFEHLRKFGPLQGIDYRSMIVASRTNKHVTNTTCPEKIASFLSPSPENDRSSLRFLVSTYKSLPKVGEALSLLGQRTDEPGIDFGVFDEAHVMEGSGELSGYGLYDASLPIRYRLFLTATPFNYVKRAAGGTKVGSPQDTHEPSQHAADCESESVPKSRQRDDVRSFSDESLFGRTLIRRTQLESVKSGITVPLVLCAIDKAEAESILGHGLDENTPREQLLPYFVKSAFERFGVKKAVSFHSTNDRAKAFAESARSVLGDDISAFHVNSKMPPRQRDGVMSEAESKPRSIVANCRLLSTGVDIADLEMCVIADPVRSQVEARQRFGRVTRLAEGKTKGYVFVPLLFDAAETGDMSSLLQGGGLGYTTLVAAFTAMVAGNPELQRGVDFVVQEGRRLGRPLRRDEYPEVLKDAFMLPSSLSMVVQNELVPSIVMEVGASRDRWEECFDLLLAFREREGHCKVPKALECSGEKLGKWVSAQRRLQKAGELGEDRRLRLENAGMVWNLFDTQWEEAFSALKGFRKREGHANIPQSHAEGGVTLGTWLHKQRTMKLGGKLDEERRQRLEDAGVVWNVLDAQWEEAFSALEGYRAREGHASVPTAHAEGGITLGTWLNKQRTMKSKGKLDEERRLRLEDVGMVWNVLDMQWEEAFSTLEGFRKREGHAHVPRSHEEGGIKLGTWLNSQRAMENNGKIDEQRRQRLEDAGVVWNVLDMQWEDAYSALERYRRREGHASVPNAHHEGDMKLGNWLDRQKQRKKKGTLDEQRWQRLEDAGVVWNPYHDQWEEAFSALERYHRREGHANIPSSYQEWGINLGTWIDTQRQQKKKGRLDLQKLERLDALGISWEPLKDQWESYFSALECFYGREGHCVVPKHHIEASLKVWQWLMNQKAPRRRHLLSEDRQRRLRELGVSWDIL